ncbi:hypothetical protein [Desulfobacter sp.]
MFTSLPTILSRMTPAGRAGAFILGAVIFLALVSRDMEKIADPRLEKRN